MRPLVPRLTIAALLVLAVLGMVAQAGSVPHVHEGDEAGIYNQEHDLTLLAGLAAQALLSDVAPIPAPDAVVVALLSPLPERPPIRPAQSGDSRAPPAV